MSLRPGPLECRGTEEGESSGFLVVGCKLCRFCNSSRDQIYIAPSGVQKERMKVCHLVDVCSVAGL